MCALSKGVRFPGAGVTQLCAAMWMLGTQVLWQNSQCSSSLSHPSGLKTHILLSPQVPPWADPTPTQSIGLAFLLIQ